MSGGITEAVIDALATQLELALAAWNVRVERGAIVARAGDVRALDSVPTLAIRSLSSTHEAARRILRTEAVAGDATKLDVTWQRARITERLVLDLYTPDKTTRLAMMPALRDAFYGFTVKGEPLEGLRLALAAHHGAVVRYLLESDQEGDEAALGDGRAHRALIVAAGTSLLIKRRYNKATFSTEVAIDEEL